MICTKSLLALEADLPEKGPRVLPDIAKELPPELTGRLERVGMTEVEVPIWLSDASGGRFRAPAKADIFVSLDDPKAKGIHMSRLFLQTQEALGRQDLSFSLLETMLRGFIDSHQGLSHSSFIKLKFDWMVERPALKSSYTGWRSYPVVMSAEIKEQKVSFELETTVTYSSTCPCSAALARQLIQDQFAQTFRGEVLNFEEIRSWLGSAEGISATPHSQRSYGYVKVKMRDSHSAPALLTLVDGIEKALGTPVQTAVKREDEQEFAKLNAQNLMFCEDAARKVKTLLEAQPGIIDYRAEMVHVESLHPHNAVAVATKGVAGGYVD